MKPSKFLRGYPPSSGIVTKYSVLASPYIISGAVVGGVVLAVGIWYILRLRSQARMREEVRSILFEYYPLEDHELGSASSLNSGLL